MEKNSYMGIGMGIFCNKKWGASYEKKVCGLSGAAARTSKLKKNKNKICSKMENTGLL